MIIMGNDIIDRTQTEEEVRKALQAAQARNAQYEQAISMISDIVWRYDVNTKGECVGSYISSVADRMLGLPIGTIGDNFDKYFSYVHPDDLPAVQETLFEVIGTRSKDKTAEYRMRKADGTTLWVLSKGSAYSQPDERITVFGITSEITERKRAEKALHESEAKVRKKLEAILGQERDIGMLNLADILDIQAIQSLMDDFYRLTSSMSYNVVSLSRAISQNELLCANLGRARKSTAC